MSKKINIIRGAALLPCMLFLLLTISGFAVFSVVPAEANIEKIPSSLDSYGKYSGTNDTSDGIILSACGSSRIDGPANGSTFWHGDAIPFRSTFTRAPITPREQLAGYTQPTASGRYWYIDQFTTPNSTSADFNAVLSPGTHTAYYSVITTDWQTATPTGPLVTGNYNYTSVYAGYKLTVNITNGLTNQGRITSNSRAYTSPSSISCGLGSTNCEKVFRVGNAVTLTAAPASGFRFVRWYGWPCGQASMRSNPTCSFDIAGDRTISAEFEVMPQPPTITLSANPATIDPGESSTISWSTGRQPDLCIGWKSTNQGTLWNLQGVNPIASIAIAGGSASTGALGQTTTYYATCSNEQGSSPQIAQVTVNVTPCGDGDVDPGEQCDSGYLNNGACPRTCSTTCRTNCCPSYSWDCGLTAATCTGQPCGTTVTSSQRCLRTDTTCSGGTVTRPVSECQSNGASCPTPASIYCGACPEDNPWKEVNP